jgi:hypothetical protein
VIRRASALARAQGQPVDDAIEEALETLVRVADRDVVGKSDKVLASSSSRLTITPFHWMARATVPSESDVATAACLDALAEPLTWSPGQRWSGARSQIRLRRACARPAVRVDPCASKTSIRTSCVCRFSDEGRLRAPLSSRAPSPDRPRGRTVQAAALLEAAGGLGPAAETTCFRSCRNFDPLLLEQGASLLDGDVGVDDGADLDLRVVGDGLGRAPEVN